MSCRLKVALGAGTAVLLLLGVGAFFVLQPAKTSAYVSPHYSYTFDYPNQWHVTKSSSRARVFASVKDDKSLPEAVVLDIDCLPNSRKLSPQSFWAQEQQAPNRNPERGIGRTRLRSGIVAYESQGQGQTSYTVYTVTHAEVACEMVTYAAPPSAAAQVEKILNSFRWK